MMNGSQSAAFILSSVQMIWEDPRILSASQANVSVCVSALCVPTQE